jgi:hypothetical protein
MDQATRRPLMIIGKSILVKQEERGALLKRIQKEWKSNSTRKVSLYKCIPTCSKEGMIELECQHFASP